MLTLDALRAYGADVDSGLRRCMNMEAFYLKMVASLKGDAKADELKDAVARGDLDAAFEAAHSLKGVCANLSLTPLSRPVEQMTEMLRRRENADYSALLAELTLQWDRLQALL